MTVAVGCTALLGVLLFGLGFFVSAQRVRHGVIIGHNLDPLDPTHRAVRAHGNTAEYAPFLAIMFLWLGAHEPAWWIQLIMVIATFSRYSIAAALIWGPTMAKPHPARYLSSTATYICGLVLAATMLARLWTPT